MQSTNIPCPSLNTLREKSWEYNQYYLGEKDREDRKSGEGRNHWSGAKSQEWYAGHFTRSTMHGSGDYFWRYQGPEGSSATYEGHFYCNKMHGYGTMSYADGRTFNGLFYKDVRWGPGVQSYAGCNEDVGLWRGGQLVRLSWRPPTPSIVPEFISVPNGRAIVESNRVMLNTDVETVGEVNNALELMKQSGADPRVAVEKWGKLYPKNCTDLASPLCFRDAFDREYYDGKIYTLQQVKEKPTIDEDDQVDDDNRLSTYFAWNNNYMMINMMKHSFMHERQRSRTNVNITSILSGPRKRFKPAAMHEIDCRSVLMASYLGHIGDVAMLINEQHVHADISDVQGNSAIMYATCGNQPDVIHFLVGAGAAVDSYNDSCCTPLGVALLRYICIHNDVLPGSMLQALVPPPIAPAPAIEPTAIEWHIARDQYPTPISTLLKSSSRTNRNMSSRKIKSLMSLKDQPTNTRKKTETAPIKISDTAYDSDESLSEDKKLYNMIKLEFSIKVTDAYRLPNSNPVNYIFDVNNMVQDIEASEEEHKKPPEKTLKKVVSKTTKEISKVSKDTIWAGGDKDEASISSADRLKMEMLERTKSTILQLLSDGADPRRVRCPYPALFIAELCNSPDLIHHLVRCGADVNEVYLKVFNYSPLDVAVSRPLTYDNLEVVRALLECGADATHRLMYTPDISDIPTADVNIPGPTLLHAAVAKKTENDIEEDIRRQLIQLLLEYNCNPITDYKGRSAIHMAMVKNVDLLEVFTQYASPFLNGIINDSNQTILVKMFSTPFFMNMGSSDRLQLFTNLLLYGADPLMKCQNGDEVYENIFVFAKKTFSEMESAKPVTSPAKKNDKKPEPPKKPEKPKKEEKLSTKSIGKMALDDVGDYKQAVELVRDCARLIYIRWLQTKLLKELLVVIDKYKHRHWSVILRQCKATRGTGLWLTPQRCLEIWDILSSTRKKIYKDQHVIRHLVSIVIFMSWDNYRHLKNLPPGPNLTAPIKNAIEADVTSLLRQYNADRKIKSNLMQQELLYIKPELVKDAKKFNVCFECILPLTEEQIRCSWCKQISFCSYACIKSNIDRANCHPCSEVLKMKYFPSPDDSVQNINI